MILSFVSLWINPDTSICLFFTFSLLQLLSFHCRLLNAQTSEWVILLCGSSLILITDEVRSPETGWIRSYLLYYWKHIYYVAAIYFSLYLHQQKRNYDVIVRTEVRCCIGNFDGRQRILKDKLHVYSLRFLPIWMMATLIDWYSCVDCCGIFYALLKTRREAVTPVSTLCQVQSQINFQLSRPVE